MNDNHDAEYLEHARTWEDFTRLMTASVIVVVLILLAMAATLT